ncbi:MAG TPA: EAL domain-containing protein [Thermoleophilaceae bacterium]
MAVSGSTSRQLARRLDEAEQRFGNVFEEAPIGMALVAPDGAFLRVNRQLCELLGYSHEQLIDLGFQQLTHPDDLRTDLDLVAGVLAGELRTYRIDKRYYRSDGRLLWTRLSVSLVRNGDDEPLYFIAQIEDISERKRFEGQLQHLADHDALTGLFNRRRFEEELARELATAERDGSHAAVLAIDLDNFKYINDSLGHSAGDELIARVGTALRGRLRRTDVLARLGGDEFAVLLPRADADEAMRVAEGLLAAIRALDPAGWGGRRATVTASIGVAPFDASSTLTAEELLVEADIAMYDAKEAGRGRAVAYRPGEERQQRMQARMTWAERIREALEHERFVLHAQPVVALNGDLKPRYELLVRMLSEQGELIPPASFLTVAERFDLVQEIDRFVITRAIALLAEQQRAGNDVCFEVNLSAKSVVDPEFPGLIAAELEARGVDAGGLCIEITETAAIVNIDRAKRFAGELAQLGCEFALDDFGSGFASFYYLKHLSFNYLKIDGEFVRDLLTNRTNQLVVKAVVDIARGLGRRTIAEFVEDAQTLELLRQMGVDYAQGYYLAKPGPLETLALSGSSASPEPARAQSALK